MMSQNSDDTFEIEIEIAGLHTFHSFKINDAQMSVVQY